MQNDKNPITDLIISWLGTNAMLIFKSEHEYHYIAPNIKLCPGYDEEPNPSIEQICIYCTNLTDEQRDDLHTWRFAILSLMQDLLDSNYSETTNNDNCSWDYSFDTGHASGDITFSVSATDYLS